MCDLTRSGDGQVAESFLSLSGRLGSRPRQLDPASITAGGSAGRKVGIVAVSDDQHLSCRSGKDNDKLEVCRPRSEPDWHHGWKPNPSLRLAISVARRFKWRRLRTGRSVHIAGTHPGRIDEWIDQQAARFFLTVSDVANQIEARQRWKRGN